METDSMLGNDGMEEKTSDEKPHLDRRIAAAVEDLPRLDALDLSHDEEAQVQIVEVSSKC